MRKLLTAFIMWFAIYGIALAAVNINTATQDELVTLKGVGEKRAQTIIDYRTKNGPFKTVDDLEKVRVLARDHEADQVPDQRERSNHHRQTGRHEQDEGRQD